MVFTASPQAGMTCPTIPYPTRGSWCAHEVVPAATRYRKTVSIYPSGGCQHFHPHPRQRPAAVYINGESIQSKYDTWPFYEITPADNDVIKIFMNAIPHPHTVTFKGFEGSGSTATKDIVTAIDDMSTSTTILGETKIEIVVPEYQQYKISVNDTEVKPTDGSYSFTIDSDATVVFFWGGLQ